MPAGCPPPRRLPTGAHPAGKCSYCMVHALPADYSHATGCLHAACPQVLGLPSAAIYTNTTHCPISRKSLPSRRLPKGTRTAAPRSSPGSAANNQVGWVKLQVGRDRPSVRRASRLAHSCEHEDVTPAASKRCAMHVQSVIHGPKLHQPSSHLRGAQRLVQHLVKHVDGVVEHHYRRRRGREAPGQSRQSVLASDDLLGGCLLDPALASQPLDVLHFH